MSDETALANAELPEHQYCNAVQPREGFPVAHSHHTCAKPVHVEEEGHICRCGYVWDLPLPEVTEAKSREDLEDRKLLPSRRDNQVHMFAMSADSNHTGTNELLSTYSNHMRYAAHEIDRLEQERNDLHTSLRRSNARVVSMRRALDFWLELLSPEVTPPPAHVLAEVIAHATRESD